LRCVRGIEVNDETLALDQIAQVCMGGPGHYLGTAATLSRMQSDHCYPTYGNRMSPKEWVEKDKPDLIETAIARKHEILGAPSAAALDPEVDAEIRARFNIHLPC